VAASRRFTPPPLRFVAPGVISSQSDGRERQPAPSSGHVVTQENLDAL
jgi:hypothetical protein